MNPIVSEDIMQVIPDEDLPTLRSLYETQRSEFPHVLNLFDVLMKWKEQKRNPESVIFLGIDEDWLKTGTFIVLLETSCRDVFISTLSDDYENLRRGFTKTKRIDFTKKTIWFTMTSKHIPLVAEIVKEIGVPHVEFLYETLWNLEREKALQFEVECPAHLYIAKLNKSHASLINHYWDYKFEGSEEYLAFQIDIGLSYGLFMKSNDSLISWVAIDSMGIVDYIRTLPPYTKNGYCTLVLKFSLRRIAEDGLIPCASVIPNNTAAQNIFIKLGFRMHNQRVCVL